MKSKKPFIEKFTFLTMLSINSVYEFSEMYLSFILNPTINK